MLRCQYAVAVPLRLALQQELDQVIAGLAALLEEAAHLEAVPGWKSCAPGSFLLSIPHVSTWTWQHVKRMFSHRNGSKYILWSAQVSNEFEQLDQSGQFRSHH